MSNNINPLNFVIPIAKTIAEYLKLIESIEYKLNKANNSHLNAAIDQLKFIEKIDEKDRQKHLPIIINEFFLAKKLENHNLDNVCRIRFVYWGLALCQKLMSYNDAAVDTLIEYVNLDLKPSSLKRTLSASEMFCSTTLYFVSSRFVWKPIYQVNKLFFKVNLIDKSCQEFFEFFENFIYKMDKEELYLLNSQKQSYHWAKEIKSQML